MVQPIDGSPQGTYYDGATRIVAQTFWSSSGGGTNNYDHYGRLIKSHAVGAPPYTVREQRILRLFIAELSPLLGAKLATIADARQARLPPRMRQVLDLLMRGP